MTTTYRPSTKKPAPTKRIPPLRNGDRLTRSEFERRYIAMPEVKKAELIEGIVYMPSPVSFLEHGQPHAHAIMWLGYYKMMTPGIHIGDNSTLRLDLDNEPQPDVFALIDPECGGQARFGLKGYVDGAPELVVEVSASSVSIDMHKKLEVYRRSGVQEYVVWRVEDGEFSWFVLQNDAFVLISPGQDGLYHSAVLPGLVLDPNAILAGDLRKVSEDQLAAFQGEDHKIFLEKLARHR